MQQPPRGGAVYCKCLKRDGEGDGELTPPVDWKNIIYIYFYANIYYYISMKGKLT